MRTALLTQGEKSLKVKPRFTSRRITKIRIKGDNQEQIEEQEDSQPRKVSDVIRK